MPDVLLTRLLIGFAINLLFGIIAFTREMVDDAGFFAGIILFTFTYAFMDWRGYLMVAVFFFITGLSIEIENKDKADRGNFELYKAKKSVDKVLGRCLAGGVFAVLFFMTRWSGFKQAFVASYAASVFDAVSTKLGQKISKEAVLVSNFQKVRHGTPGAVSWQGSLLGAAAAVILCAVAFVVGLIRYANFPLVLISSAIGAYMDSCLNAYSFHKRRVPNELINFLSSFSAGAVCVVVWWFLAVVLKMRCMR
jgi:uncharacterized protein (TIGR00297 family)